MKLVLSLLVALMAAVATPVAAQHAAAPCRADREVAAPDKNAALQQLTRQHSAYLADLLRLSTAQVRHLYRPTYTALQQLRWAADTDATQADVAEALATSEYRHHLAKVLTPNQYATLLAVKDYPPAVGPTAIFAAHR